MSRTEKGKVYLIGAGPGAGELITLAGHSAIRQADVIIYDRLLSEDIFRHKKTEARLIYAGKLPRRYTLSQDKINQLLIKEARAGKIVARLKGGDPFLFGRGSEEALALAEAKIPFEVIPGVSAGFAAASYAGIPLTHRGISSQVIFVTAHEDPAKKEQAVDWNKIAKLKGTLVIFMGMGRLENIIKRLLQNGLNKDVPAAIVQWGTLSCQKTITATLENIAGLAKKNKIANPATIIIGETVKLREKINWYETKPLFGKRILITRPLEEAQVLSRKLESMGADTALFPVVEIAQEPRLNPDVLLKKIRGCDWLVFTSRNAVDICFRLMAKRNKDARFFAGIKTAVLGPETGRSLAAKGISADLIPDKYTMEDLSKKFSSINMKGKRVFIPHSRQGRNLLSASLKKQSAQAEEMFIYGVRRPRQATAEKIKKLLEEKKFDLLTFTSSSAVHQFMKLAGSERAFLKKQVFAVIGPVTAATLKSYGYAARISANEYTIDGLCRSIEEYFRFFRK